MSTLSFAGDEENKILYKVDGDLDDDIRIRKTTKTAAATIRQRRSACANNQQQQDEKESLRGHFLLTDPRRTSSRRTHSPGTRMEGPTRA
jgi:hypothetical protein